MVRKHIPPVTVLAGRAALKNLQNHRREKHPVRIGVLRLFSWNGPPAGHQSDILPPHRAHLAAALRCQQHDKQHVVEHLREPCLWPAVRVRCLSLVQRRPELAQLVTRSTRSRLRSPPGLRMRHAGLDSIQSCSTANVNIAEIRDRMRFAMTGACLALRSTSSRTWRRFKSTPRRCRQAGRTSRSMMRRVSVQLFAFCR